MTPLKLTLSCGYYDRTLPVLDGRVEPEGIQLVMERAVRPGTSMGDPTADVYETSNTVLTIQRDRGSDVVGLPIFPRRKFFQQLLLVREDSAISSLAGFRGKRVGILRWYQHALGVWLRGYLKDAYKIHPKEIQWYTERESLSPANGLQGLSINLIGSDRSLAGMLEDGELDVLCHEDAHEILFRHPRLKRLFPNFKEVEAAYFRETGFFPINHMLAIKERVLEKNPWAARSLVEAFKKAKALALDALDGDNSLISTPWVAWIIEEQGRLLKRDMFPYGLEANRKELEAHVRYLYDQGLISKVLPLEEIFARGAYG